MHNYVVHPLNEREQRVNREILEKAASYEFYSEWVNPVQFMPVDLGGLPALTYLPLSDNIVMDMPQNSLIATSFRVHREWKSGLITFKLHYAPSTTDADTFDIRIRTNPLKNTDDITAVSSGTTLTNYAVPGGTANLKLTFEPNASGSAFSVHSCPIDQRWDWINFRIFREVDNNGGNFRVIGVEFFYTEVNRYIG